MKRLAVFCILAIFFSLALTGSAMAVWPDGAQGDQYAAVNAAMDAAVAGAGISPETFISIYDTAAAGGDLSQFTDAQLAAACSVLNSLSGYSGILTDYQTVYDRLGCSSRAAVAGATRGQLPSTGVTALAMVAIGSVLVGVSLMARRRRSRSSA